jgi:hypothetical protein
MRRLSNPDPTPYPDLNAVLDELVDSVRTVLGEKLIGAYLQGSFAVGDFDRHSDVDFIIAIADQLSAEEARELQEMHGRIYDLPSEWAKHLEGSYFPVEYLRQFSKTGHDQWYLDHGSRCLVMSDHCDTLVVRSTVRDFGVTLYGPKPASLIDPVPVKLLQREIYDVMHNWGGEILADTERYNNRFYQGFIVLSYCRMLYDLGTGRPGSKREAAEWAKATLDPSWNGLIDRAWECRPDPATSVRQPADPVDFNKMLSFIRYVLEESKQWSELIGGYSL